MVTRESIFVGVKCEFTEQVASKTQCFGGTHTKPSLYPPLLIVQFLFSSYMRGRQLLQVYIYTKG